MRPLPSRLPSKSAKWALRIASFLPFFGLMIVASTRLKIVDLEAYSLLLWLLLAMIVCALILVVLALVSLWTKGTRGGRRASWALFFCTVVLAPYLLIATEYLTYPAQSDVSTDLIMPPLFLSETSGPDAVAEAVIAASIQDGYPDIEGQRFRADMVAVYEVLRTVASDNDLRLRQQRGRVGANDEVYLEFSWESDIVSWPHEAVIRITDEGETTFVDIRSRSLNLTHDRGANAKVIKTIQRQLDVRLIAPGIS